MPELEQDSLLVHCVVLHRIARGQSRAGWTVSAHRQAVVRWHRLGAAAGVDLLSEFVHPSLGHHLQRIGRSTRPMADLRIKAEQTDHVSSWTHGKLL